MSSLVLSSLLRRRYSWIFHESHVCFISCPCVYAGAKIPSTIRGNELMPSEKLRVGEGIRASRPFNNSLDVEYSEWRSTLQQRAKIVYGGRGGRKRERRYFAYRTSYRVKRPRWLRRRWDQPHGAMLYFQRFFILLLSLFAKHSLLCTHVNSVIGLKANARPRISISFRPIETSLFRVARIWQIYHGNIHTLPVDVDLFYVRCLHKFSCVFPRMYTFRRHQNIFAIGLRHEIRPYLIKR